MTNEQNTPSSQPPSVILGTAQLGTDYGLFGRSHPPDDGEARRLLEEAVERGIRHFDTAPTYGNSEKRLGDFFSSADGSSPSFTTKVWVDKLPGTTHDDLPSAVERCVRGSLERLQSGRLHGVLIHHVEELARFENRLLDPLLDLRDQGVIQYVGVSIYSCEQLETSLNYFIPDIVQISVNLLDRRLIDERCRALYRRHDFEIHARSVFLQGLVFRTPSTLPPALAAAREPLRTLRHRLNPLEISPAHASLGFVRSQPEVDALLLGVENVRQLRQNLDLLSRPLPEEVLDELNKPIDVPDSSVIDLRTWPLE